MYEPQTLIVQFCSQTEDGIGGFLLEWQDTLTIKGYVDLMVGTDQSVNAHKAIVEESSHVIVVPEYVAGIDATMRIVDEQRRVYSITYVDDVMNVHHHLEIYCQFEEVIA